ncbi:TIGR03960 family B12-binding radical SAM protein [Dendrosporobacter sp. 1207_IL3150]|uniref:TIGR03960 family B12-binding radical SAM protein n=1 Tax=Dendrosporobacter sp. 1207_IL3150 TaxID=3084054 RepID=UPI002FDA738F
MIKLDPAIISRVMKPARYTGNELNSVRKDHAGVKATVALALPDVYEVGMSNLGLKILYQILNDRPDTAAERVYAPWVDMEAEMRSHNIPLYTLESFTPVKQFDMFGFSLQYEMIYSNVLNMLDMADIPLMSADRDDSHPFIIGGGPCVYNAEPVADFFDLLIVGEGEEVIEDLVQTLIEWKDNGKPDGRIGFLKLAASIDGIYVPSFYNVSYNEDGTISKIAPNCSEAKALITKRVVKDLNEAKFVTKPVVPYLDIVHDRIMLELFRGCTRGCRFCQAGVLYRPVRERTPETLLNIAKQLVDNTGYNEISLTSLSSADYSCLSEIVRKLITNFSDKGVSVSLPSLRIDSFSIELAKEVQQVRKSGLTFAPEAGTQRMRDVINKGVTERDLEEAVGAAFRQGWSSVKLYFMIGLPTETDEDVLGIADLAYRVLNLYKEIKGRRGAKVTVSVSSFVPKANTAFQWFGQNQTAEIERKQQLLKSRLRDRSISFNYHDSRTSFLEGVFSRGDRRLSKVLLEAWRGGVKFDGWSEHFKYNVWMEAFEKCGIDPHFYASRDRDEDEIMPWQHLSCGVDKEFLSKEYQNAIQESFTPDCRRDSCSTCGVCPGLGVEVLDWGKKA